MVKTKPTEKKPTKIGEILPTSITTEIEQAYLDYAMSVIVSRALPDVRDGLKPVQRRIIYAMHEQGMHPGSRYQKCAAVVGEVLKKYHPHGDMSVYDALVRMGQDFSLRYLLIDGQGNFGSVDGDAPAAMRYTECRLAKISNTLLNDIDKKTVDFVKNYSGTEEEPSVLPSLLPNLLLNGCSGIAVGMATQIPPHNLSEVVDALTYIIDHSEFKETKKHPPSLKLRGAGKNTKTQNSKETKDTKLTYETQQNTTLTTTVTTEELTKFVKSPDFPTAGLILDDGTIKDVYETGRGRILMRGKAEIVEDEKKNRFAIVITELPYQVNKANFVAHIGELVKNKKLIDISDLRDESDRSGQRVVIELKKEARPQRILKYLYKRTDLEKAFNANFVVLVDGEPKNLGLKDILVEFIKHRQTVVIRRTQYLLDKALEREHILQGLKIALDHLDAVIETIKKSKDAEVAKTNLMKKFGLTEIQAIAILDMQLRRLAALERQKIEDELKEIVASIKNYRELLASTEKILKLIKEELLELKKKFGDERKTKIIQGKIAEIADEDLIPDQEIIITITKSGYIKRMPSVIFKRQARGGKGVIAIKTKEEDFVTETLTASTHDRVFFFTNKGKVYSLPAWEIPESGRNAKGTAIINLLNISQNERITALLPISKKDNGGNAEKFLFMATKQGIVKKSPLSAFKNITRAGLIAISLSNDNELWWVKLTAGQKNVLLVTSSAKSINFHEKEVRPMGRTARGVRGIRLQKDDTIIGMVVFNKKDLSNRNNLNNLAVVSQYGFGKKSNLKLYRLQKRGGAGILTARINKKTGKLVNAKLVNTEGDFLIMSKHGQTIRLPIKSIPKLSRATKGVHLIRLNKGDEVATVAVIE